jgi:hypothetical protein
MTKELASQKVVEAARQAWYELVLVQNHMRAHRKVTYCLPKHKEKRFEKIMTQINIKMYNAQNKWNRTIEKLPPQQVDNLYKELVG